MIIFRNGKPYNTLYQDLYASEDGAVAQAHHVFLQGNRLPERFAHHRGLTVVGELGFGFGINFLVTAGCFLAQTQATDRLFFASCELHPPTLPQLKDGHLALPLDATLVADLYRQWPTHPGFHLLSFAAGKINLLLMLGEATQMWREFQGAVDAWYLDGFAPTKNPAMWSAHLFTLLRHCSAAKATFATYSVASQVKAALTAAGWQFEKTTGFGRKKEMLRGSVTGLTATSSTPQHITIVGAGLAGSALAFALKRRGVAVTLCDRQREPSGASGNPAGILMPMVAHQSDCLAQLCARGFAYTSELLRGQTNIFRPLGIKYIPPKNKPMPPLEQLPFGGEFPIRDGEVKRDSLFIATGGIVLLSQFCHWLRRQVAFQEREILDWRHIEHGLENPVVLAAGAEMRDWPQLNWLPLRRLYGQVSLFSAAAIQPKPAHVLCSDAYLLPLDGEFLIGATFDREKVPYAPERVSNLLCQLQQVFQLNIDFTLAQQNHGRVSFRSVTYDRYPFVGQLPAVNAFHQLPTKYLAYGAELPDSYFVANSYLFTGFGSRGLSLAPLLAEVLAAQLCGEPLPLEKSLWQRLLPKRFLLRNLRRPQERRISF